jgi:hypothetical protein
LLSSTSRIFATLIPPHSSLRVAAQNLRGRI